MKLYRTTLTFEDIEYNNIYTQKWFTSIDKAISHITRAKKAKTDADGNEFIKGSYQKFDLDLKKTDVLNFLNTNCI